MTITGMRPTHIIAGLMSFAIGLFLFFKNILYCVEFIKGGVQPLLIGIGLAAAATAIFRSNHTQRTVNIVVGILLLVLGSYGVYDEYYATMDFLRGLFPPILIIAGLLSLTHGITCMKSESK